MKKIISFLLCFLLIISCFSIDNFGVFTVGAEGDKEAPLVVSISSTSPSYRVFDSATVTVTIKNTGKKTIDRVSAISSFSDVQPVGANNTLYIENRSLQSGETIEYSFSCRIKSSRLNLFEKIIMFFKNLFDRPKSIPDKNFDDGRVSVSSSTGFRIGKYDVQESVTVWFEEPKKDAEIVNATSPDDFGIEVSNIVRQQMTSDTFDQEKADDEPYYSCRIIVCGTDLSSIDFNAFDADKVVFNDNSSEAIVQFSTQADAIACEQQLNQLNNVEFAEADQFICCDFPSNDEPLSQDSSTDLTWGEAYMHANQYAKYLEFNNFNDLVTVAVVDSGVDLDHPFLNGRILSNGYDYVNTDADPDDDNGHGTHVAGIIVDCTNKLNVKIMPVKVMDQNGQQSAASIIGLGITHAANNGADVINLSICCSGISRYIDRAITSAIEEKGAVFCIAAGNGDEQFNPICTDTISPAHLESAIVVGAIDNTGTVASFSNYGASVDLVAPGAQVVSSYRDGMFAKMDGTSMATPHISASAAMMRLRYPDYTPSQIEEELKKYCIDLGHPGRDDYYGNGYLNLYNAIPDCTVRYQSNGGTSVASSKVKSTTEIKLPSTSKSYSVTLNANGGSISTLFGSVSSTQKTVSCSLDGWYKNSFYTGVRYAPGDKYMATKDETFYAKWNSATFGNQGIPTKTGCEFLGWFSSASGGSQYYYYTAVSGNITVYAHWKALSGNVSTNGSNSDGRQLSISWASSGLYWLNNGSGRVDRGSGTSFNYDPCPTQGCYAAGGPLRCGAAVFEISNLDSIRSYIRDRGAKITKIEFSAFRFNTNHGMYQTGQGHLWAATNRSGSYGHGTTPSGTKLKDGTWPINSTFSCTITDQAVLNNFLGVGSSDYRSFMFYGGSDLSDYIRIQSVSVTIYFG